MSHDNSGKKSHKTKTVIYNSDDESSVELCGSSCESNDDNDGGGNENKQKKQQPSTTKVVAKPSEDCCTKVKHCCSDVVEQVKISSDNTQKVKNSASTTDTEFVIDYEALGNLEDYIAQPDELDDDYDYDDDGGEGFEDALNDHQQNIARASFGDMVNDWERNRLFDQAIRKSVQHLRDQNVSEVFALDIGCGTGLLSMMAIRAGADRVLACDIFKPMAECAKKIIKVNGMEQKINVVFKQSNSVHIEENQPKPNLLVAELLDTELIGEGCIFAYRDAIKRLTNERTLFVPSKARVYIQLVQSASFFGCHQFAKRYSYGSAYIDSPKSVQNCFGSHLLHDIQMSRLKPGVDFDILSQPQIAYEFEFNNLDSLKLTDCKRLRIPLLRQFTEPILIFSWWDLDMDYDGEIVLSCAPYWARGFQSENDVAWRDHWMQTIYYLPAFAFTDTDLPGFVHAEINQRMELLLDTFHDSFCFRFDLPSKQCLEAPLDSTSEHWYCNCLLHVHLSRARLYNMNSSQLYKNFMQAFQCCSAAVAVNSNKPINLLYLGDESIVPLLLANLDQVEHVYILLFSYRKTKKFFQEFLEANDHIRTKVTMIVAGDTDHHLDDVRNQLMAANNTSIGIISEMFYQNFDQLFPWFDYYAQRRRECNRILTGGTNNPPIQHRFYIPNRIVIKCLLVKFDHLWRSFADVGNNVEGFDLTEYDQLIQNARQMTDWRIEPYQVWEYSCEALMTTACTLYDLPLADEDKAVNDTMNKSITINMSHLDEQFAKYVTEQDRRWPEKVALVVWTEYVLDTEKRFIHSTGPTTPEPFTLHQPLVWPSFTYQGVAFLGKNWPAKIAKNSMNLLINFHLSIEKKSLTYQFE